jgi:hypothetical protein
LREPAQAGRLSSETGGGPADGTAPDAHVPARILILNFGEGRPAIGQGDAVMRNTVLPANTAGGAYPRAEQSA